MVVRSLAVEPHPCKGQNRKRPEKLTIVVFPSPIECAETTENRSWNYHTGDLIAGKLAEWGEEAAWQVPGFTGIPIHLPAFNAIDQDPDITGFVLQQ